MSASTTMAGRLRLHEKDDEERKISWLELFYDLVYVATIIQLGDFLSANVSPLGALLFVLLFLPIWWSWTGMMFYFNRFRVDDLLHRVLVFAQMFAIAFMAVGVSTAFGPGDQTFALAYFAVRMILVLLYLRARRYVESARPLIGRYVLGFTAAASLWAISAFVPPPYRYALWTAGLFLEFWVPLSPGSRRLQSLLPPDRSHLAERYGLFTIIVLGESFIKVVGTLAGQPLAPATLIYALLAFTIAVSIWWLYFHIAGTDAEQAMDQAAYLWIYAHLPLTVGITAVGVALKKVVVLEIGEPIHDPYRWLLVGAVGACLLAVTLLGQVLARRRRLRGYSRNVLALASAVIVLAVGAFAGSLPGPFTLLIVAAACYGRILGDRKLLQPGPRDNLVVAEGTSP